MFEFRPTTDGQLFDLIYDRAAFVAITPARRTEYVCLLASMLRKDGILFLDTIDRPGTNYALTDGPPFSASPEQIKPYFVSSGLFVQLYYHDCTYRICVLAVLCVRASFPQH